VTLLRPVGIFVLVAGSILGATSSVTAQGPDTCFFGQVRTIGLTSEPGGHLPIVGATATLYRNGTPYLSTTTNASGIYFFTFSAPTGSNSWYVRATHDAGWIQVNHTGTANTSSNFCTNGGLGFAAIEMARIRIKEIGFKNDHLMKTWEDGDLKSQKLIDFPDGSTSTWILQDPSYKLPVAYSQGSALTMFAIVEVTPATFSNSWSATLRATVSGQVIASEEFNLSVGYPGAARPGLVDDIATTAIDSGVGKKSYTISFEVAGDSVGIPAPEWQQLDSATQTFYWTVGAPAGPPLFRNVNRDEYVDLYDKAVDWACGSVCGGVIGSPEIVPVSLVLVTDTETIVWAINRAIDKAGTYDPVTDHNRDHPLQLMKLGDKRGNCSDNANLLAGLLRSIGVDAATEYYYAINPANSLWMHYNYRDWSGRDDCIASGCPDEVSFLVQRPAHDVAPPNPHFRYHAIVSAAGRRWDPSYGLDFVDPVGFEEALNPATGLFVPGASANIYRLIASELPSIWYGIPSDPTCEHALNAVAVSTSVPNQMIAGQSYTVAVTMKNTGTLAWTIGDGFGLLSENPRANQVWGWRTVPLPGAAPVGEDDERTFTFVVVAPTTPGGYNFQWRMLAYSGNNAWPFGAPTPNVVVNVVAGP
jgi:hypothetical protein